MKLDQFEKMSARAEHRTSLLAALFLVTLATHAHAQVAGNTLALKSSGAASGSNWTLSEDGYVGTYIQLSQATPVTFALNAAGTASGGLTPQMTLSIANKSQSFNVSSSSPTNYGYTTPTLPAGTYFVRVQLDNQNATQAPSLTISSLLATGTGVTVLNSNTSTNAINAAQSYIDNFRQGQMNVKLVNTGNVPLAAGTHVQARLVQNAFSIGSAVYDTSGGSFYSTYPFLTATASSTGNGALAYKFQQFLANNFNMVEPENAGKWASNESAQNVVNMTFSDQLDNFAEGHNMRFRQHNLIWHSQQPNFVSTLFTNHDDAGINNAVTNRIGYYIAANNAQPGLALGRRRARGYDEIDILNESSHATTTNNYMTELGASGVANIFKQAALAMSVSGGNAKLYVNEYNVLQNSSNPATGVSDPYANWYRRQVEQINNAGMGKVVSGIGTQLYITSAAISAATVQQALQNLSVTGLPISETEFGINTNTSATQAATDLQQAFTMFYGTPNATTFNFWGFWLRQMQASSFMTNYQAGALIDVDGNPTPLFTNTWLPMLQADNFILPGQVAPMDLTVGADGSIDFKGTYGTYAVTFGDKDYLFTSTADNPSGTLVVVPEPASLALLTSAGLLILKRPRRKNRG